MDDFYRNKHEGRRSHLNKLLLLLCLTGLQPAPVLSSEEENEMTSEPDDNNDGGGLKIVGPDYVTVSVPSSVVCQAACASSCTYSMALDGQVAQGQGNVLAFTINSWVEAVSVTCTVTDDDAEKTTTATKRLQVLAGPANVSITGANQMNPTVSHTYSCHAYCRPSCTYSWQISKGPWISGQGNVISVTPQEMDTAKTLNCKATNTVSGLFVAATRTINVTSGPAQVKIDGPDVIEVARKYTFACTAACWPNCRYLWFVDNQTLKGSTMEMTAEHRLTSVAVKCEAQNTVSKKSATAVKTVWMQGHNPSTRPVETKALLPFALIISAALAL